MLLTSQIKGKLLFPQFLSPTTSGRLLFKTSHVDNETYNVSCYATSWPFATLFREVKILVG